MWAWLSDLFGFGSESLRRRTSSLGELADWVKENMPELDLELRIMPRDEVRIRLNSITGLDIGPLESVSQTAPLFLAALKEMKK